MGEFFTALFLVVFVLSLIYVVKKLLESEKRNVGYKKFVLIPINNNMPDIAKIIKAAYWDNDFSGASTNEVLVYPVEEPDEICVNSLNEITEELEGIKIIEKNKLEDYINSKL